MIGVSFQPGSQDLSNGNGARPSQGSGVQEAIKVLSLRLPKVLGAQASVPMPLLTSQGSGGNPRVDSIVNQVLSRVMPQQQQPMPVLPAMSGSQPGQPPSGPSFSGSAQYQPPKPASAPWAPPPGWTPPRVVVDAPNIFGPGEPTIGQPPPGFLGELPPGFEFPQTPPNPFDNLGRLLGGYQGGGGSDRNTEFF